LKQRIQYLSEDKRLFQGAMLLLVSLGVFFFSSLLLYAIYVMLRLAPTTEPITPFFLPTSFILTTVVLISISVLLHLAVEAVRLEQQAEFKRYVVLSFVLALVFFATQGKGLSRMTEVMMQPSASMKSLYSFTLFLVLVHALHVVGGVAGMVFLLFGINRQAYDHERYFPVRFCAIYWHFLDVVWIVMLACFWLAAYVSRTAA
jgi:heme/copper-type cytochrome/quinol oxidase subunit 3